MLTFGTFYCTITKDPKEMKRQKVKTILEHASAGFLVRSVAYRGHFGSACLGYHRTLFREAEGAFVKKIILYL